MLCDLNWYVEPDASANINALVVLLEFRADVMSTALTMISPFSWFWSLAPLLDFSFSL